MTKKEFECNEIPFCLTKFEQNLFLKLACFTPDEEEIFLMKCNTDYTHQELEDKLKMSGKVISNKIKKIKIKMEKVYKFLNNEDVFEKRILKIEHSNIRKI